MTTSASRYMLELGQWLWGTLVVWLRIAPGHTKYFNYTVFRGKNEYRIKIGYLDQLGSVTLNSPGNNEFYTFLGVFWSYWGMDFSKLRRQKSL